MGKSVRKASKEKCTSLASVTHRENSPLHKLEHTIKGAKIRGLIMVLLYICKENLEMRLRKNSLTTYQRSFLVKEIKQGLMEAKQPVQLRDS